MAPLQNQHMFAGCFQISISAIVNKHVQNIGIIRVFCLPRWRHLLLFSVPGGQKNLLGCGLLGGSSTQADTMYRHMSTFKVLLVLFLMFFLIALVSLVAKLEYSVLQAPNPPEKLTP